MLFVAAAYLGMVWMAPSSISFQVNEDINASNEVVYKALYNEGEMTEWMHGLKAAKQTRGEGMSIASEYQLHYPDNMIMNRTVTQCIPNSRLSFKGEVTDFFTRADDYSLQELDSNHTRISCKVEMKSLSLKSKLMLIAKETHQKNTSSNLASLKSYLETKTTD